MVQTTPAARSVRARPGSPLNARSIALVGATRCSPWSCIASRAGDFAQQQGVGIGYIVSTGSEAGMTAARVLEFLVDDARIRVVILLHDGIRVHDADDRWEIALVGRNLTNERYGIYLTDKPGGPSTGGQILAATGRTRELGVQGTVRF